MLLIVCLGVYWAGLGGPLLFDSKVALEKNPEFHLDPAEFNQWRVAVLSSASGPTGRPVSMLSLAINHALAGGVDPFWFKLGNLLLHCLIGTLVYLLLRHIQRSSTVWQRAVGSSSAVPLVAAAIWLLHPLQLSSVLYTVQRMEQLSALFILLGLLVWVFHRGRWLERGPEAADLSRCLAGLLVCFALAVLSKEDGVLLLPLLLWVELVFYGFVFGGHQRRLLVLAVTAGGALSLLALSLAVLWPPDWLLEWYRVREFTVQERVLTQLRVLWAYLGLILIPDIRAYGLHHDALVASRTLLEPMTTLYAALAWLAVVGLAIAGWRRWPVFAFAAGWFLLAHALESSIVPLEMMYEHRNYLPLLGPALWVGWLLLEGLSRLQARQRAVLAGVLLVLLAGQTAQRAVIWAEEERMAAYHLRHHPDSPRSIYHYANTQLRLGEAAQDADVRKDHLVRARRYYEHILTVRPTDLAALVTLLYIDTRFFDTGRTAQWREALQRAVRKPVLSFADGNALGLLLRCKLTQTCDIPDEEFVQLMNTLIERYPNSTAYLDKLALFEGEGRRDYAAAIRLSEQALRVAPDDLSARLSLIAWYSFAGEQSNSVEMMRELLEKDGSIVTLQRVSRMLQPGDDT